jgi:hypothetical protein
MSSSEAPKDPGSSATSSVCSLEKMAEYMSDRANSVIQLSKNNQTLLRLKGVLLFSRDSSI